MNQSFFRYVTSGFRVIEITRDRRSPAQQKAIAAAYLAYEQKQEDERLEREFQERVRRNELRRALARKNTELPSLLRRQAG